jgi:hypothetical protein
MISADSVSQLRRLMELRDIRDNAKKAAETAETEYRDAEADVYAALEENPVKGSIKVDLGEPWGVVAFYPRSTIYAKIIDPSKAQEHFEQRAMIDELSAPKFVMGRINDIVRTAREQDQPMPPGVSWYERRGVTITRQKG